MRNPSLIFAALLVWSGSAFGAGDGNAPVPVPHPVPTPTAPQAPAAPLAFKRDDWKVVEPSANAADAIKKACPAGALAAQKTGVDEAARSVSAKLGLNVSIDLYCVRFNDAGQATVSPVDRNVLDLTLHKTLFGSALDFHLNRGPAVAVRDPGEAELKPADKRFAALSEDEKYWLAEKERDYYVKASADALAADKRLALETQARHALAKHLPSFARAEYARLTKAPIDAKKVSAYLDGLIAIRDEADLKKLAEIKKGKGLGAHLERDDARQDYEGRMKILRLGPDGRPLPGAARDAAVKTVAEFRGLLRARTGKAPGKAPAQTPGDKTPKAVVDLTNQELDWLTPAQRNDYAEALKPGMPEAERGTLDQKYRDLVAANLRPADKAAYAAAVAEMTPSALEAALAKIPHYSGTDIALTPDEVKALAGITKDKVPAGFTIGEADNAQAAYNRLIVTVRMANGVPAGSGHLQARDITTTFRNMLAAAKIVVPGAPVATQPDGKTPPANGQPAGPRKTSFTPDELKLLTASEATAFDLEYKAATTDDARADVVAKYQHFVDERKNMKAPTSLDEFAALTPVQKDKFCEPFLQNAGNGSAAATAETRAKPELIAAAGGEDQTSATMEGNTATGDVVAAPTKKPATPGAKKPAGLDAQFRKACDEFAANRRTAGNIAGPGDVPSPGMQPGTDKGAAEKKKDEGDPAFYKNLANGMAMGMFGLILGSFFGGPLVMFAAAAVLGGGAFMLSKKLNKKEKKDDGGGDS